MLVSFEMASSLLLFVCLLSFGGVLTEDNENNVIVTTSLGQIKGTLEKSYYGRTFRSFKGIQYGKSPTGNLRFKPPVPLDPWPGVVDATQEGPQCMQLSEQTRTPEGSENCLFLNVFVPEVSDSERKSLPVMVFIHGGNFMLGSGSPSFYGPDKLMDYDIILVTFNYRLGMFGFLNTQDAVSPGSYGFLDQLLVLKWIKEHIMNFGGDPQKVTLFGHSAGGGSVVLHLLSPLSQGLFSGAIAQSGASMSPWAYFKNPLKWARKVAEKMNCASEDTREILTCFENASAEDIVRAVQKVQVYGQMPLVVGPSIEGPGGAGFLTEDPTKMLKEHRVINKVPFISGIVPDEGQVFNLALRENFKSNGTQFLEEEFPLILSLIYEEDYDMSDVISELKKIYYKQEKLVANPEFFNIILNKVLTDVLVTAGVTKTLDCMAEADVPTYAYFYTHMAEHSFSEFKGGVSGRFITHGDELNALFRIPNIESMTKGVKPKMNSRDAKASQIMISLWVDFAYGKVPTVKDSSGDFDWLPYDATNRSYLNIKINPEMKNGKLSEKFEFWTDDIYNLMRKSNKKDEL